MADRYCTRCDGLQRTSPNAVPCTRCNGTGYEPANAPQPPAGASVSERAREAWEDFVGCHLGDDEGEASLQTSGLCRMAFDAGMRVSSGVRALEQALTQQRGECDRAEQIVRDACEVDPADPDHPETICIRRDDLMRIVTRSISGSDGGRTDDGVPCKAHPDAPHGFDRTASHSIGRYVCECEGWSATTPQPGAEALREAVAYIESYECDGRTKQGLVWADHPANTPGHRFTPLYTAPPNPGDARLRGLANEWRERSASLSLTSYTGATLDKCADELESLLARGGK